MTELRSSSRSKGQRRPAAPLALATMAGLAMAIPSAALAQSAPTISESAMVTRRALVERAQAAARANNHEQALAFAEQAGRIEMSPSLRLFIAQERAALGRHASAMEFAELCVREASRNEALERREMILAACRQVLSSSQRSVVLLALSLPSSRRAGFVLRVDGRALSEADVTVPIALDPGEHIVEASAPTVEVHRETVRGAPGAMLSITIPERFAAPEPSTQGAGTGTGTGTQGAGNQGTGTQGTGTQGTGTQGTNGSGANSGSGNGQQIRTPNGGNGRVTPTPIREEPGFAARAGAGPFVALGLGGALVITSGVMAAVAQGALSSAGCRAAGAEIVCLTQQQADAFRMGGPGVPDPYTPTTVAQVSLGVGLAAIVGGTIWMAVAGSRGAPRREERVARGVWFAPVFSSQNASLTVGGAL